MSPETNAIADELRALDAQLEPLHERKNGLERRMRDSIHQDGIDQMSDDELAEMNTSLSHYFEAIALRYGADACQFSPIKRRPKPEIATTGIPREGAQAATGVGS